MTAFEELEQDVNRAVTDALANREAVINGVVRVRGVFERNPGQAVGMVDSAGPVFTVSLEDWDEPARDDEVAFSDEVYRVISVERDGTGLAVLSLALQ
jgi:hypothetical protein